MEEKFVDMDKAIAAKSAKLHHNLSRFGLMSYVKKVMHQDELNSLLNDSREISGLDFIKKGLEFLDLSYVVSGIEKLPEKNKKVVFASNHPVGGGESLALMDIVANNYSSSLKFLVNDLLLSLKPLHPLWVPVNNLGGKISQYYSNFPTLDDSFKDDSSVLVYPAGLVSKIKRKGVVYDYNWNKTFISRSKKHSVDYITPIHVGGRLSKKFYALAWISRNILKLKKTGLETFYLVDEMIKQRGKTLNITIGESIPVQAFGSKPHGINDTYNAQRVKDYVYDLAKNKDAVFDYSSLK